MKQTVSFGSLKVSEDKPIIVANVSDLDGALKVSDIVDALEIRCDVISERGENEKVLRVVSEIREKSKKPLLATIRKAFDGGEWYKFMGDEEKRKSLFFSLIDLKVDAIDVEVDSEIKDDVIAKAKDNGLSAIVSYHNFFKTEPKEKIESIIETMLKTDADILKLAFFANTFEDTMVLFNVLKSYIASESSKKQIAVIGMGSFGRHTRVLFPFLGSCITYGYDERYEKEYAPGQLSIQFLRSIIDKFPSSLPLKDEASINSVLEQIEAEAKKKIPTKA
jgi:3-dehydroquinate dehydratase-1